MVYSAFLPTIEKVNHKTQLQSLEKYNLEKKTVKITESVVILGETFYLVLGETFWFKITNFFFSKSPLWKSIN